MKDALKESLIVRFILVFFGLIIWGLVSFYLVNEATLYIYKTLYNSKPFMNDIIAIWAGMNALSFGITLYRKECVG